MNKFILNITLAAVSILFFSFRAFAGPPFLTDDPQPVALFHWEFYVSSNMQFLKNDVEATLPHFEINYGLVSNLQVHLLAPIGYVKTNEGKSYGYMDTELGVKYRFININDDFMVGIFPLLELPTGNKSAQLGNGKTHVYLPVWIQKSWGRFTTYGGAGYWFNPGKDNKNYSFFGWEGQYDFSKVLTFGSEIYFQTSDAIGAHSTPGFNFGGYINVDENNHILFSIGHSLDNSHTTTAYAGYQLTI